MLVQWQNGHCANWFLQACYKIHRLLGLRLLQKLESHLPSGFLMVTMPLEITTRSIPGKTSCKICITHSFIVDKSNTVRSEIIMQLIPQKIIEFISRNDYASFAQSSVKWFVRSMLVQWQNGHCANWFLQACYKNSKKAESNNKITQSARKNSFSRVISRNRLRQFRANIQKIIPQELFCRTQCFLNGGYVIYFSAVCWAGPTGGELPIIFPYLSFWGSHNTSG